jgi:hypothetical protein
MSRLRLGNLIVWLRLASMYDVWKLHCILNEEDGDVVSNDIPVAFFGVELDSEASDIANSVGGSTATQNGREAQKDGRCAGCISEDAGRGNVCGGLKECEFAKGARAAGVDDTLGDALMVEAVDLRGQYVGIAICEGGLYTFSRAKWSSRSMGPCLSSLATLSQSSVLVCLTP